jgi:hypothetical protein
MRRSSILLLAASLFLVNSKSTLVYAAIAPGANCSKIGLTQVFKGKLYTCIKLGKKKVWNKGVVSPKQNPRETLSTILSVPEYSLKLENMILTATVVIPSAATKSKENIEGIKSKVLWGEMGLTNQDSIYLISGDEKTVLFNFNLASVWSTLKSKDLPLRVAIAFFNSKESGRFKENEISLEKNLQIGIVSSEETNACKPRLIDSLPWASQRIAIVSMNWVKESNGYVYVELKMRNDNQMSLRLVNYSFDYWYRSVKKSTAFNTGTSLVQQFFVKDDPKLMGIEGIAGAWKPNQERTFRIQLNEMLDCSLISLFASDFRVITGIGD